MSNHKQSVEVQESRFIAASPDLNYPVYRNVIDRIETITYFLNRGSHFISMVVLFLLMTLTSVDVIARFFFNSPINGAFELTGLGLIVMVFCSLGYTQIKRDHISIDFLTTKFPEKMQHIIHITTSIVMIITVILTSWQLFLYAGRLAGQTTPELLLALSAFAFLAGIGVLLFVTTLLLHLIKTIMKVVGKR